MDKSRMHEVAYYYREKTIEKDDGDKITVPDGEPKIFRFEPRTATTKDFIGGDYPADVEYLHLGVHKRVAQNIKTDMTIEYRGQKYRVEAVSSVYGKGYTLVKAKRNIPNKGVK